MKLLTSMISGLAGSVALTLLHQQLKSAVEDAPAMDELGMETLEKSLSAADVTVPSREKLYEYTLAGDLAGNAAYYSLVGINPKHSILTGAALGLAAGIGAIVLPEKMGLDDQPSNATRKTQVLTLGLYLAGGLVAGVVHRMLKH